MDEEYFIAIVIIVSYLSVRIAYWWGKRWKTKATHAYMIIGQCGASIEECEWGYRNALLAGEQKAMMFYACAAMRKFMDEQPLTPNAFENGLGETIPFVFYDYYLPMRIRNFGTEDQRDLWRTRQTLWRAVQMLTQKLCCQTIHDCPKVVPLHYESEWQ